MARKIHSIITVKGKLKAVSPIHVGGTGFDVDTDLPLARDGQGRYYIPGTSLAGALRDWFRVAHWIKSGITCVQATGGQEPERVRQRWGFVEERTDAGIASRVIIEDALVDGDPEAEIRDGVGIDRVYGSAAPHVKFDRAILPAGTTFDFKMHIETEDPADEVDVLQELSAFLDVFREEGIRLGAAVTRGLGRVALSDFTVEKRCFSTRQGILQVLAGKPEKVGISTEQVGNLPLPPRLRITIHWKPVGPVMVKAGQEGLGVDMLPLATGRDSDVALVIPGSSIKGALRSHAERIMRTLLNISSPGDQAKRGANAGPQASDGGAATASQTASEPGARRRFLLQLDVPLVRDIFGYARRPKRSSQDKSGGSEPSNRGVLSVSDCHACDRIKDKTWRALLGAPSEQEVLKALNRSGTRIRWDVAFHVAVDRWTGGAAQGMLYTVLEPHAAQWEAIRLELDLFRLPDHLHLPAVALLLLLLRDMSEGWIPLGFGTNRGLGAIEVTGIQFALDPPSNGMPVSPLHDVRWNGSFDSQASQSLPLEFLEQVRRAWRAYLEEAQQTLGGN